MVSAMTVGYDKWQSLIAEAFLSPHDGPTIFFLDEGELTLIAPDIEDPPGDLAEAVRGHLRLNDRRRLFDPVMSAFRQWKRGPQKDPPPTLPLLAITVLAATRMRSDTQARSTNYYLRLAQVLLPSADTKTIEALRDNLRGEVFLDVVEMWQGLHKWIEAGNGLVGLSTIRDHPKFQRIGYPLSQALIRQTDRMALTRLFRALDTDPGTTPDAEAILGALDIWTAAPHNRLSSTFMRGLADPDIRPLLATVVEAHAQGWDGRVLTNDGKQRIAIGVCIDLDAWQTGWLFPIPPGGPENLVMADVESGSEVVLEGTPGFDHYYVILEDFELTQRRLFAGMQLHGSEFTAEFSPAPVLFLRPDPETGAWSSVSGILPFEDHLVAVSAAHQTEFQQVLREAAAEGWRIVPQLGSVLMPGYVLLRGVRFADAVALKSALSRHPALRGMGVAPALVPRARLVHGLPIATSIAANHYLVGGEPDLLLPTAGDYSRPATVVLDGRSEQLQANGFPLELRRFVTGAGRHIVNADGRELSFITLEEGPDPRCPPGTAELGWIDATQMGGANQEHLITGGLVADVDVLTSILARRGRDETCLLHEGGRIEFLTEPGRPAFLAHLDNEVHLPCFEINAVPSARWLAQRRGDRWRLTEVGPLRASEYDLSIDILTAWKRACSDPNGMQLWQVQINMARIAG